MAKTPIHPNHDNTINFIYFMNNYTHNFINEIWSGSLAQHLQSKFISKCNQYETSTFGFLKWFYELDGDNQTKLLTWVNENYSAFSYLKISEDEKQY